MFSLVRALQLDRPTPLRDAVDPDPVVPVRTSTSSPSLRACGFHLHILPVLDAGGRILNLITVDDALEAAIRAHDEQAVLDRDGEYASGEHRGGGGSAALIRRRG